MILWPHPAARRLAYALHPGTHEQQTRRGRTIQPRIAPYVAFTVGGRHETSDPRELRQIAAALEALADDLDRARRAFAGIPAPPNPDQLSLLDVTV